MYKTNVFNVCGTLGDSFSVICKLWNVKGDIKVYHKTHHTYWFPEIRKIYNLHPNIEVEFVEEHDKSIIELSGVPTEDIDVVEMEYFPELNLPESPVLYVDYLVIQAHCGRADAMARLLSTEIIYRIIERFDPLPVVLLGTLDAYKGIENCENLVGKTSVIEMMSIIKDSCGFIGPEGLPCYVALSCAVDSIVFYPRKQVIENRILPTPWNDFVISYIHMNRGIVY